MHRFTACICGGLLAAIEVRTDAAFSQELTPLVACGAVWCLQVCCTGAQLVDGRAGHGDSADAGKAWAAGWLQQRSTCTGKGESRHTNLGCQLCALGCMALAAVDSSCRNLLSRLCCIRMQSVRHASMTPDSSAHVLRLLACLLCCRSWASQSHRLASCACCLARRATGWQWTCPAAQQQRCWQPQRRRRRRVSRSANPRPCLWTPAS